MPEALRRKLAAGARATTVTRLDARDGRYHSVVQIANETPELIPAIALLCERDARVARVLLCHAGTMHVGKQLSREGGFCGYRNIQMLISYIQAAYPPASHPFAGRMPSILALQDMIEAGWDKGINASARTETGGIRGTRKYIGTSEVAAPPPHRPRRQAARADPPTPRRRRSSSPSGSARARARLPAPTAPTRRRRCSTLSRRTFWPTPTPTPRTRRARLWAPPSRPSTCSTRATR